MDPQTPNEPTGPRAAAAGRTSERIGLWAARVLWVILPFTAGPGLADALAGHSPAVQTLSQVGLWLGWAVALSASAIPRSSSMTVVRAVAPGALAATLWAVAAGAPGVPAAVGVVSAALAVGAFAHPATVEAFIDGSSYGDERRLALRLPPPIALAIAPLTWLVFAAGVAAGPLLLAARQWIVGGVLVVVGWPLAWVCVRRLHVLARRWVVFVPAGLVLHDPLTLTDASLVPKRMVASLGPAPASYDGLDVSMAALGLALELRVTEPIEFELLDRRGRPPREVTSDRVAFTPTRPATLLELARQRRLPVG